MSTLKSQWESFKWYLDKYENISKDQYIFIRKCFYSGAMGMAEILFSEEHNDNLGKPDEHLNRISQELSEFQSEFQSKNVRH